MKTIEGFCYVTRAAKNESRAYWQQRVAEAIKAGGWRRVEHGETFVHRKDGRLVAEIYANISNPLSQEGTL